jgi:hypothetical protein
MKRSESFIQQRTNMSLLEKKGTEFQEAGDHVGQIL